MALQGGDSMLNNDLNAAEKSSILSELHNLLAHNVIGEKQYRNRYNGFMAELDFQSWFELNRSNSLIDGGMFIPTKCADNPFDSAIYITSSESAPNNYVDIYTKISAAKINDLFFIQYCLNKPYCSWDKKELFKSQSNNKSNKILFSIPPFKVFKFIPKSSKFIPSQIEEITAKFTKKEAFLAQKPIPEKLISHFNNKFSVFTSRSLLKLYLARLFFDGYLNLTYRRGAPLDIDFLVQCKEGDICILEIKEKDLSKREPIGFGMDLRRVDSLTKLTHIFASQAFYIVRQVNNQTERAFIDWQMIEMQRFKRKTRDNPVVTGGTGMRSEYSYNPTKVCEFKYFTHLK